MYIYNQFRKIYAARAFSFQIRFFNFYLYYIFFLNECGQCVCEWIMVKHEIFSPIYNILKKKNICGTKQQHDNENNVHRAIVKKIDTKKIIGKILSQVVVVVVAISTVCTIRMLIVYWTIFSPLFRTIVGNFELLSSLSIAYVRRCCYTYYIHEPSTALFCSTLVYSAPVYSTFSVWFGDSGL